jgi:hypothetical protein
MPADPKRPTKTKIANRFQNTGFTAAIGAVKKIEGR